MLRLILLLAVANLLVIAAADAQQTLAFRKNKNHVAYYKKGDVISYRLAGGRERITSQIEGFTDSTVVFHYGEVNPKDIRFLYVDDQTRQWFAFRYKYEKLLLIAGFGYLMLDVINTGELTDDTKWMSLSMIGAGLTARFLITDRFKLKGRKRLIILDL